MSLPLLKTVLYVQQPSPNTVSRACLRMYMDRGLTGRLTLVAAPAGFGKTTLISCWLQEYFQVHTWFWDFFRTPRNDSGHMV